MPGLIFVIGLLLLMGALVSICLAGSGFARTCVLRLWCVVAWLGLLAFGAVPALLWHGQPPHVWEPMLFLGVIFMSSWWILPLINRRYKVQGRKHLTPG